MVDDDEYDLIVDMVEHSTVVVVVVVVAVVVLLLKCHYNW